MPACRSVPQERSAEAPIPRPGARDGEGPAATLDAHSPSIRPAGNGPLQVVRSDCPETRTGTDDLARPAARPSTSITARYLSRPASLKKGLLSLSNRDARTARALAVPCKWAGQAYKTSSVRDGEAGFPVRVNVFASLAADPAHVAARAVRVAAHCGTVATGATGIDGQASRDSMPSRDVFQRAA